MFSTPDFGGLFAASTCSLVSILKVQMLLLIWHKIGDFLSFRRACKANLGRSWSRAEGWSRSEQVDVASRHRPSVNRHHLPHGRPTFYHHLEVCLILLGIHIRCIVYRLDKKTPVAGISFHDIAIGTKPAPYYPPLIRSRFIFRPAST